MSNPRIETYRLFALLIMSSGILSCTSQPIEINHYLLNTSESIPEANSTEISPLDNCILVTGVNVPDYLQNRNLVMQQSDGILSVATKHVWAQPLDSDFGRLLANSLNKHKGVHAFFAPQGTSLLKGFRNQTALNLSIVIEHFMPLETGYVVLSGYWQTEQNDAIQKPVRFAYSKPLNQDGYAHSVARMRELIAILANEIYNELTTS